MKRLFFFITLSLCTVGLVLAQDAKTLLDEGLKRAQVGDLQNAIQLFDQSLALKDDYPVRQSRGTARSLLREYEVAIDDFTKAIQFNPKAKKSYLNRGIARKKLTDYEGALADFNAAVKIDPRLADALYNRGLLYELLSQRDKACADYKAAQAAGMALAAPPNRRPLLRLSGVADDLKYGLAKENPVKVGAGTNGDRENIETYLDLLRDGQNKPVRYRRVGASPFFSKNAPGGKGSVQGYEVRYLDANGQERKKMLYLTSDEFEEPMVVAGFGTLGQKAP